MDYFGFYRNAHTGELRVSTIDQRSDETIDNWRNLIREVNGHVI